MSSTKPLLVKRHISRAPKEIICDKIRVSTRVISELHHFLNKKKKKKNKRNFKFTIFAYALFTGVFGYFEHAYIDSIVNCLRISYSVSLKLFMLCTSPCMSMPSLHRVYRLSDVSCHLNRCTHSRTHTHNDCRNSFTPSVVTYLVIL